MDRGFLLPVETSSRVTTRPPRRRKVVVLLWPRTGCPPPLSCPRQRRKSAPNHQKAHRAIVRGMAVCYGAQQALGVADAAAARRNVAATSPQCLPGSKARPRVIRIAAVRMASANKSGDDAMKKQQQQLSNSAGTVPWNLGTAIGGIESVVRHVDGVMDRILWGMVGMQSGQSQEWVEGALLEFPRHPNMQQPNASL